VTVAEEPPHEASCAHDVPVAAATDLAAEGAAQRFEALTAGHLILLHRSAAAMGTGTSLTVAELTYAQLADTPGTEPILDDLTARVRSMARFLEIVIGILAAHPLDTGSLGSVCAAAGRSHARLGVPPVLLDLESALVTRSMALAAAMQGRGWTGQDADAWDNLLRIAVDVQKSAYAETPRPRARSTLVESAMERLSDPPRGEPPAGTA
jgi:hypothetical protein